jgi:hypothetical protein
MKGQRIPINQWRNNLPLAGLMLDACKVSTMSFAARIAIQRLEVHANRVAVPSKMRKFSAVSEDGRRLYVPLGDGDLAQLRNLDANRNTNGKNEDGVWVEHPYGDPFQYCDQPIAVGLGHFERLLVETLACEEPFQWLVAMEEGLFPFVRDLCSARLIFVHVGESQSGKTTGAQRFTLLHGLGKVKGDYSVAAYRSIGDIGLLVMDNREQANLSQEYIDYLLFLATDAESGRCRKDGSMRLTASGRPVGVVTSIEGIGTKPELRNRCVEVPFSVTGEKRLNRSSIEREINEHRSCINSALMFVVQVFFAFFEEDDSHTPNPLPAFEEHFKALCCLLRAYGVAAGKESCWAESIIEHWGRLLAETEVEEDSLERYICKLLRDTGANDPDITVHAWPYKGRNGKLYVTTSSQLLTRLEGMNLPPSMNLPNAGGLGRRLKGTFLHFKVLDEKDAPDIPALKRTKNRRPIGFWVEDDGDDASG